MLRIMLLMVNVVYIVLLIIMMVVPIINDPGVGDEALIIPFSLVILLSILNIYFIIGTYRGPVSLYLKRKKLEEEIKIQEAENRLEALQKKLEEEEKEKK
jgi:hypothetical protein